MIGLISEGGADDDTHSEVHHIALHQEGFEFVNHSTVPLVVPPWLAGYLIAWAIRPGGTIA
jgi:hypothetical protein